MFEFKRWKIRFLTQVFAFTCGVIDRACFGIDDFINLSLLCRHLSLYWCRHQQWFLVHASLQGYRVDQEQEKFSCAGVIILQLLLSVREPNVLCVKIKLNLKVNKKKKLNKPFFLIFRTTSGRRGFTHYLLRSGNVSDRN